MSVQSESVTGSVVDVEETGVLPNYLQVLHRYRVVLCTTHGCCYTQQNLSRHLLEKHHMKGGRRSQILRSEQVQAAASSTSGVVQPVDGADEIKGLPTTKGFLCHFNKCEFRSTSHHFIRQHYNKHHQWQVSRQGQMPWHEAYVQTLFTQKQHVLYFAVVLADQLNLSSGRPQYIHPHANAPDNAPPPPASEPASEPHPTLAPENALDAILSDFDQLQTQPQRQQLDTIQHVSDLTPWMKRTGIYIHLQGLTLDELGPAWELPKPEQEPILHHICKSAGRVLMTTMLVLVHDQNLESRELSRRNARLLNTFTRGAASQDPIQELQNHQSRCRYADTWKQLLCYWDRVVERDHLRESLFQASDEQLKAWVEVTKAAAEALEEPADEESSTDGPCKTGQQDRLDQAVQAFSLTIIQHLVRRRKFDSVLVSYAAARFWIPRQRQWMQIGKYTSILSQLIYDCQMIVLAQVLADTQDDREADIGARIMEIRDQWLLNDTDGPVAELLENRLLGFHIGRNEVPPAQLRWHVDGETLVWTDIIFHLSDLHNIVFRGMAEAQQILKEELCLSSDSTPADEIPNINLNLLVDNWDATSAGQSFLTDTRNASHIDPLRRWLITRVTQTPELFNTFFSRNTQDDWMVTANSAQQYENAVFRFLQAIMVPVFLGSGQQGRRTEFIGLRWKNSILTTRDLFLHDGQMLFILSYHKTRSQSNASRWPVRFLLPEVAQLVTKYLAIIQPFREFLHHKSQIPEALSEYLFSAGKTPWKEDRMTKIVVNTGKRILGKHIHIQAWRQITVGIARRKFAAAAANMLIEEGEGVEDEETDPALGSMVDALHWQAGHTPRTGNRVYGGTVNFRAGLTDAGLQEYRHVSQLWHQFVRDPIHFEPQATPVRTPRRPAQHTPWEWDEGTPSVANVPASSSMASTPSKRRHSRIDVTPIAERVIRRAAPTRSRRRWSMNQAMEILQRMYGEDAKYRSEGQQRAMEHILTGAGQVVAVLRTSEGKSLLYLLPCQLPGAGTTVVILPLVVLKDEMRRRCGEAGIEAHVWEAQSDPDRLHSCPLIMVAVEQAVTSRFREYMNRLHMANQLDRIVFDECHLAVTAASYRKSMGLLPQIRELQCQMVFLTGTLPPTMVPEFERNMLLQGARLVRSSTVRRDIHYGVSTCPPNQQLVQEFALPGIQQSITSLEAGTRAIIYCWRKDVAEEVARGIDGPVYHSTSGSVEEKARMLQQWRDGEPAYIVATSAFGLGIDHPAVRQVIHVGVPRSMVDFAQEVGRLGRSGGGGHSVLLVQPQWKASTTTKDSRPIGPAEAAMQGFVSTTCCRVKVLAEFLDEKSQGCAAGALTCDNCESSSESMDSSQSETEVEASEPEMDNLEDLRAGGELLRRKVQGHARQLHDYIASLQAWVGVCMICYHLPGGRSERRGYAQHQVNDCSNGRRFQYFDAKREAQRAGQSRGGWFRRYSGCYRCFNPQTVCEQQGRGQCEFADLVMPICWAVVQQAGWRQLHLKELGGEHIIEDPAGYMLWLGEERQVFGEAGSNAVAVACVVLEQMGGG